MASKRKIVPEPYLSKAIIDDTFASVFETMLKSEEYQNLSLSARYIYVLCRNQHYSKVARSCLYKHAKEMGITYPDNCFVFPAKHQREYGLMDRSNVARALRELEDAGFIKRYEDNKRRWKVNVYQFSEEWKKK